MIEAGVWVLKDYFRLTELLPFFLALATGVALLFSRAAAWGRRWLAFVVASYWLLSIPAGSWLLAAPLIRHQQRVLTVGEASGVQAVVVLGGGIRTTQADGFAIDAILESSALRVIEGVRVSMLVGNPLLIVSGGNAQRRDPPRPEADAYRIAAVALGIPADRVISEGESQTTRDQVVILKKMLAERHIDRFVLVTSPLHMMRSLAAFRSAGLNPVPSATRLRSDPADSFWSVLPDIESLSISDGAVYEYAALAYYAARGWLSRPTP